MTLHELAAEYGVSAERIRQIEVAAMKKMKKSLAEYAWAQPTWIRRRATLTGCAPFWCSGGFWCVHALRAAPRSPLAREHCSRPYCP